MRFLIGLGGFAWAPLRFAASGPAAWPRKDPRCPACWSRDCAKGVIAGSLDRAFLRCSRVPYECRSCGKRFRHFDREIAAAAAAACRAGRAREHETFIARAGR